MHYPTATEWLKLIEEFRAGEMEQKEFAASKDVSLHTFRYWLYKKAKAVHSESKPVATFVPVQVVGSAAPKARQGAAPLEVVLPSGVLLRVPAGLDTRYLAEVVAALG